MAVLNLFGAELNSATVGMESSDGTDAGAALTISSAVKRTGSYSLRVNGLDSGTSARATLRLVSTAALGPYYCGCAFRVATAPSAANTVMRYEGGTVVARVTLNNARTLTVVDEDGTIATSSTALTVDTWYNLIFEVNGAVGAGSDVVRLHIYDTDGNLIETVGAATRDIAGTIHSFSVGGNMNTEAQTTGDWYFDDVTCCDSAGSSPNSVATLVGVRLERLTANGDGDADVSVSRGGADSGTDVGQVDEETPNDATDYIALTANPSELFVDASDPTDLQSGDTIRFVAVGARMSAATTTASSWFPSIKTQAAGTEVNGTSTAWAVTTWHTHDDTLGTRQYKLVQYTDPQGGGAWTQTLVNSVQLGAKTVDGNPDSWCTALWGYVGFITVAAGTEALPGTGQLDATGIAPTVQTPRNVLPGAGALSVTGFAASLNFSIATATGLLTADGFAPTVNVGTNVTAGTGALMVDGAAPTIATTNHQTAAPGSGAVDATGFAPTVNLSDHQNVTTGTGLLAVDAFPPVVLTPRNVLVDFGVLTVDGYAPSIDFGGGIAVGAGALTLDGYAPDVTTTQRPPPPDLSVNVNVPRWVFEGLPRFRRGR